MPTVPITTLGLQLTLDLRRSAAEIFLSSCLREEDESLDTKLVRHKLSS
jgi:hypothetical protein